MLKRSEPHPLWNILPLFNQLVFKSGKVAAWKGYNHVSASLEYPRGGRSKMDQDPEGQPSGYGMTSLQTVPCYIALSCWKIKMFQTG